MTVELDPSFVQRLRRALGMATSGVSTVDDRAWRRRRDELQDLLEPTLPTVLQEVDRRRLIDLLAESAPDVSSRMSGTQWSTVTDELVIGLLGSAGAGRNP